MSEPHDVAADLYRARLSRALVDRGTPVLIADGVAARAEYSAYNGQGIVTLDGQRALDTPADLARTVDRLVNAAVLARTSRAAHEQHLAETRNRVAGSL